MKKFDYQTPEVKVIMLNLKNSLLSMSDPTSDPNDPKPFPFGS